MSENGQQHELEQRQTVSQCREQASEAYNGAGFEVQKGHSGSGLL